MEMRELKIQCTLNSNMKEKPAVARGHLKQHKNMYTMGSLGPTTYDPRPTTHDPRPTTHDPRPTEL